jgi:hypothetical protein
MQVPTYRKDKTMKPLLISSKKKVQKKPEEQKSRRGASFSVSLLQLGNVTQLHAAKQKQAGKGDAFLSIDEDGKVTIE